MAAVIGGFLHAPLSTDSYERLTKEDALSIMSLLNFWR